MKTFLYNDIEFSLVPSGDAWDISRKGANGASALVGSGLFAGLAADAAALRAQALVKTIYPVGVRTIGPDVTHPHLVGDLKIVGPDVTHPNFIYWDKDSSSPPQKL
jgi:hypothetical protein